VGEFAPRICAPANGCIAAASHLGAHNAPITPMCKALITRAPPRAAVGVPPHPSSAEPAPRGAAYVLCLAHHRHRRRHSPALTPTTPAPQNNHQSIHPTKSAARARWSRRTSPT
jgi:hypothetical protein